MMSSLVLPLSACMPAYVDAVAPKDASFEIRAAEGCGGDEGRPALAIEVRAGGAVQRRITVCCGSRSALLEKLEAMRAPACDGVRFDPVTVAGLTVGTTESELTGRLAITLDQGEGYVAFQCDGWLPRLVDELGRADCGRTSATASEPATSAPAAPPAPTSDAGVEREPPSPDPGSESAAAGPLAPSPDGGADESAGGKVRGDTGGSGASEGARGPANPEVDAHTHDSDRTKTKP